MGKVLAFKFFDSSKEEKKKLLEIAPWNKRKEDALCPEVTQVSVQRRSKLLRAESGCLGNNRL